MSEMALELIRRAKEEGWKRLDLGNCGIVGVVPEEVGELDLLEELYLGNKWKKWENGSWTIQKSTNDGEPNRISVLPALQPKNLVGICAANNPISDISSLRHWQGLIWLDLSGTLVADVSSLEHLQELLFLGLEKTRVQSIAPLSQLLQLEILNLDSTRVRDISPLRKLNRLKVLDLDSTEVSDVIAIEGKSSLRVLILNSTYVEDLAPLSDLLEMEVLGLSHTKILDIKPLAKLVNLRELWLSSTETSDIGPLEGMIRLEAIGLESTKISDIKPICNFKNLRWAYLSHTQVADISPLEGLKALELLGINFTKVSDLSPLKKSISIKTLGVSSTLVSNLSPIRDLIGNKLQLYIDSCPLMDPPYETAQQGNDAILRYWERQDAEAKFAIEKTTNWHCKLVIVGNGGVGKSTLLEYLKHGADAPETKRTEWMEIAQWIPDHEFPARVMDHEHPSDEQRRAQVQVFDFGGQEYYHDTHHLFFSTNTAYLVLWNVEKNRLGREEVHEGGAATGALSSYHYPLEYWLDAIRHLNGISTVNPSEEIGDIQIEEDNEMTGDEFAIAMRHAVRSIYEPYFEAVNGVPALVVQTYLDQTGMHFLDQASLTRAFPWIVDFESVSLNPQKPMRLEILKAKLLELIGKIPILGAAFSTTYAWVRDAVLDYPGQATMSVSEFRDWVNGVLDDHPQARGRKMGKLHFGGAEIRDLIGYLGSLGSLLHFPDGALDDRVFLRPDLLKAMILELLRKMSRKRGFFTEQEAAVALEGLSSPPQLKEVLALLQAFKMAFQIGPLEDGLWAAPLYLPEEAPEGIALLLQVFDRPLRRISFKHFIHKSVVLEFFQQHVQEIKSQSAMDAGRSYLVWRNGMVLQTPDSKELVLVRFFIGEAEPQYGGRPSETSPAHIDIFSFGSPPTGKAPAERVIARLRTITKAWRVEEEVTVDGRDFVPLAKLRAASAQRETHFMHVGKTIALEEFAAFVEIPWDRIFVSYAEEDEAFCEAFRKHIWPLEQRDKLIIWGKGQLKAGMHADEVQQQEMQKANIVVLLVSADYFYDRDIWHVELKTALARAARGECKLAVVVVRACDWKATELAGIHHLNPGRVVGNPGNDLAWVDVVGALRGILNTRKEGFL